MRKKQKRDVLRGERRSEEKKIRSGEKKCEEKEIRSEEKKSREEKSKGREKRPRSGCLTSANETIRPSQCFGKRACGARLGVGSATNK